MNTKNNHEFLQQIVNSPESLIKWLPNLISITECSRRKGSVDHVGLKLEFNHPQLNAVYLHTNPTYGRHLSCRESFADGKYVRELTVYEPSPEIIARLEKCLANRAPYSIFDNCQHLVSLIITGIKQSPQLAGGAGGAVGGYLLAKANNATPGGTFVMALIGALFGTALTSK